MRTYMYGSRLMNRTFRKGDCNCSTHRYQRLGFKRYKKYLTRTISKLKKEIRKYVSRHPNCENLCNQDDIKINLICLRASLMEYQYDKMSIARGEHKI